MNVISLVICCWLNAIEQLSSCMHHRELCTWLCDRLGLTLIANIQQHQYVTEVGTTAGLIVLVQPQDMMPFPEDRGKLVSPGYQTEFAITQVLQYK